MAYYKLHFKKKNMETHLTIKHLAPYLPYGLKMRDTDEVYTKDRLLTIETMRWLLSNGKPILRPLSDLFNGNYGDILDEFSEVSLEAFKSAFLSGLRPLNAFDKINYTIAIKLFENHFDVFELIEQGLALDINQVQPSS